jgi:O-antigen/teichoic acid export membrane protein
LAWAANIIAGPAYFTNLGTGQVAWNTLSHVLMGVLNASLGWLLGRWYGAHGVAFGYAIALVSGSAMLIAVFGYRQRQPGALMREHLPLVLASLAVASIGWLVPLQAMAREPAMLLLGLLLPPLVLAASAWCHPLRRQLLDSLRPRTVRS